MTGAIFVEGNFASSTRRNRLRRWIARRRRRDGTTGLRRPRAFASAAQRGAGGVVALFDVDGMKRLNDTWGIPGGESVLRALGSATTASGTRARAYRIAGDQTALTFRRTSIDEAVAAADRVRVAFAEARFKTDYMNEPHADFTLSAGVATSAASLAEAFERAEAAVRVAKAAGGNRVVVWSEDQALAPE